MRVWAVRTAASERGDGMRLSSAMPTPSLTWSLQGLAENRLMWDIMGFSDVARVAQQSRAGVGERVVMRPLLFCDSLWPSGATILSVEDREIGTLQMMRRVLLGRRRCSHTPPPVFCGPLMGAAIRHRGADGLSLARRPSGGLCVPLQCEALRAPRRLRTPQRSAHAAHENTVTSWEKMCKQRGEA